MKQSGIFTKARREAPADEVFKSAQLLIRAGFINKEMAGVYDLLPLGLRVFSKIQNIISQKMIEVGGQELSMSALQEKKVWEKTDRWDDEKVDNWFKTSLKNGGELGLGFTHEEPLTRLMLDHIKSYKDLPVYVFQFQTKFRNELRTKSGIIRGREFLMKDLYSFSLTKEDHSLFYEKMKKAYLEIFQEVGLGDQTFLTFASGGSFSKYSHEFQTVTEVGEDTIYLNREQGIAINQEVLNEEVLADLKMKREDLTELKTIEVGNIFSLETKFSDAYELLVDNEQGERVPVIMGSYGIGLGRLMGTIAEVYADEKGLVWPEAVAPFKYHLVNLLKDSQVADDLYQKMLNLENKKEVLYDDRELQAGVKLSESDLLGIPYKIVIGKTYEQEQKIELINRQTGNSQSLAISEFLKI